MAIFYHLPLYIPATILMATEPEIPYYLSFAAKILIFSETAKGISLFQHRETPRAHLFAVFPSVVDDGQQYTLMAASGALDADESALISTQR